MFDFIPWNIFDNFAYFIFTFTLSALYFLYEIKRECSYITRDSRAYQMHSKTQGSSERLNSSDNARVLYVKQGPETRGSNQVDPDCYMAHLIIKHISLWQAVLKSTK